MSAHAERQMSTPLLLIAGIAALVVVLYLGSYTVMAQMWGQSAHNHGYVVLPISAILLWRLRASLAEAEIRPWGWGLPVLAALALAWGLANVLGVQVVEQFAAIALIPAAVAAFLGPDLTRRALFPLLFLFAALPLGDALLPHLMRITADISAGLLRAAGVPVYRQGQFLTLPGGEFEIADVCGGLRYLTSGTIVALLFGYLTYCKLWKRAAFVAAAAVGLVVLNGIRAFVVMLVASATEMRYFTGKDHVYFGWLLFAVAAIGLFWLGAKFADPPSEARDAPESAPHGAAAPSAGDEASNTVALHPLPLILTLGLVLMVVTAKPFWAGLGNAWVVLPPAGLLLLWAAYRAFGASRARERGAGSPSSRAYARPAALAIVGAAAVLLAVGPLLMREPAAASPTQARSLSLPPLAGCSAPASWAPGWHPRVEAPDFHGEATYLCGGVPVHAFVAGYEKSVQGRELVSGVDQLIPKVWRRFVTTGRGRFATAAGGVVGVNEIRVRPEGRQAVLVWYWYAVGAHTATTPLGVKFRQALRLLSSGRSGGTVYLLATDFGASRDETRGRLARAARELAAARLLSD